MIMVRYMWHTMLRKFFPHDMRKPEKKNFKKPDVLFDYPFKGKGIYGSTANLFIGRNEFRKIILSPGWVWTLHAKPLMKTDLCMYTHIGYLVSGGLTMKMKDGTLLDYHQGDAASAPAEHDGWVNGDVPLVVIEQTVPEGLKLLPLKKMFATPTEKTIRGGWGGKSRA